MNGPFCLSEPSGSKNQDRVAALSQDERVLIVLADGAGGFGDGGFVAQKIVSGILDAFLNGGLADSAQCATLLRELDQSIRAQGEPGESTAAILIIAAQSVYGASVGDSGVIAIDQSGAAQELTCGQRRRPLLGTGRAEAVAFGPMSFRGTLVVASDGLLKYTTTDKICEIVARSNPRETPENLLNSVRLRSGGLQDDTTIAVYSTLT